VLLPAVAAALTINDRCRRQPHGAGGHDHGHGSPDPWQLRTFDAETRHLPDARCLRARRTTAARPSLAAGAASPWPTPCSSQAQSADDAASLHAPPERGSLFRSNTSLDTPVTAELSPIRLAGQITQEGKVLAEPSGSPTAAAPRAAPARRARDHTPRGGANVTHKFPSLSSTLAFWAALDHRAGDGTGEAAERVGGRLVRPRQETLPCTCQPASPSSS
jgi:hypothetical protein